MGAEQRILDVKDALAQARSLFRIATPREEHEQPWSADPTPPPMPAAPGPVASAARLRGATVEKELSILAAELGTGRDAALVRALGFYRRFVRRARRAGQAPEEFLRTLVEEQGRGDVRLELAEIRSRLDAITSASTSIAITTTAPAPEPVASITFLATPFEEAARPRPRASALEIFRAAKGRKSARGEAAAPTDAPASSSAAAAFAVVSPSAGAAPSMSTSTGTGTSTGKSTGKSTSIDTSTSTSAASTAARAPSGPGYAERRAKLPKITF